MNFVSSCISTLHLLAQVILTVLNYFSVKTICWSSSNRCPYRLGCSHLQTLVASYYMLVGILMLVFSFEAVRTYFTPSLGTTSTTKLPYSRASIPLNTPPPLFFLLSGLTPLL